VQKAMNICTSTKCEKIIKHCIASILLEKCARWRDSKKSKNVQLEPIRLSGNEIAINLWPKEFRSYTPELRIPNTSKYKSSNCSALAYKTPPIPRPNSDAKLKGKSFL
jgi:hypothetical protein